MSDKEEVKESLNVYQRMASVKSKIEVIIKDKKNDYAGMK